MAVVALSDNFFLNEFTRSQTAVRHGIAVEVAPVTLLLGTGALFWGKISGDVWAMSVVGLVAIYVGGDVGARFSAGAGK